jgi:hypothetical protein
MDKAIARLVIGFVGEKKELHAFMEHDMTLEKMKELGEPYIQFLANSLARTICNELGIKRNGGLL